MLTGDAANQRIIISADNHNQVFAGGGNDSLVIAEGIAGINLAYSRPTTPVITTLLHGGQGNDVAIFSDSRAHYNIESHDSYVLVTSNAQPNQQTLLINVESLQFSDSTVTVENRSVINTITGLYQTILGRQGDYLGVDYWGEAEQHNNVTLGQIAINIISSTESQSRLASTFNDDNRHDIELLYQGIFNRNSDRGGLDYWLEAMHSGMTLDQVAQNFVIGPEFEIHKIGVQNWDFIL